MNAPMQANGAEMMRIAACLGIRAGVQIDAVLHDAFLIEADRRDIDDVIATMRAAMGRASRAVLGGVEIGTDVKKVCWPGRYMDKRGAAMWKNVMGHLDAIEREELWSRIGPPGLDRDPTSRSERDVPPGLDRDPGPLLKSYSLT
jgi:DNA polymerase I